MNKEIISSILNGDRRAIAKALTIVESTTDKDRALTESLISKLFEYKNTSTRIIGFSGITGSGKSSLIEEIGKRLLEQNKKIAVLAIDPSSPIHGGSILGDKTRMSTLSNHPDCFVRPVPSKFNNGGISRSTREAVSIFSAAKYDYIFIETVGVGQTEYSVSELCDCFVVNLLPATGDELQGVKKGINELADIILINKADGALETQANLTVNEYKKSLMKPIVSTSIYAPEKIEEIIKLIDNFFFTETETIKIKRELQNQQWAKSLVVNDLEQIIDAVTEKSKIANPYHEKKQLIEKLKKLI